MSIPLIYTRLFDAFHHLVVLHYIRVFRSGYIDLSKRQVDPEDVVKCEERYNKVGFSVILFVKCQRDYRLYIY